MVSPENNNYEALDVLGDAAFVVNKDYEITFANMAAIALCEKGKEEIIGQKCYDSWGQYSNDNKRQGHEKICDFCKIVEAINHGQTSTYEKKVADRVVEVKVSPVRNRDGTVTSVTETCFDITLRKRAEAEIRRAEQEWQDTFDAAIEPIIILDNQYKILKANRATAELLDSTPEKLVGQKCYTMFHGKDCPPDLCPYQKVVLEGKPQTFSIFENALKKDLSVSLSPLFNSQGQVDKVVHITHDITRLKQLEKQMASLNTLREELLIQREIDKKLKRITDNVISIFGASLCRIWLIRPGDLCASGCIHAHADEEKHCCQDTSKCLHLMASSGLYSHIDGAEHGRVPMACCKVGRIASGEMPKFISNDVVHDPMIRDQQWAQEHGLVSFAGYRLLSEQGGAVGVLGLFCKHPITAEIDSLLSGLANTTARVVLQARVEQEAKEANAYLENIFNASIPICITGFDYKIIRANDSYVANFGPVQMDDHSLKCYESRPGPSCHTKRCPFPQILGGAKEVICESSKMASNDEEQNFIVTARPFLGPDGTLQGIHESFQDITEHRKLERELAKLRNLESLGHLAGGIAHDFNNLMTAVLGNIEIAKMILPPDSEALSVLKSATEASLRTKELTGKLLTFSKGGHPVRKETALGPVIEESCLTLFQSCKSGEMVPFSSTPGHFKYTLDIAKDLLPVAIDPEQIRKAFHHILFNAMEAVGPGGEISVTAANTTISSENSLSLKEGQYILATIHDNGRGITKKDLPLVFNPYFSTKEMTSRKGVGLGLAMCLSIIRKHEGNITIDSNRGKGTTVYVYLPARLQEAGAEEVKPEKALTADEKVTQRKGKILILEDEAIVFEIAEIMLDRLGYDNQWAQEGNKAIELYKRAREAKAPFDAVIFDLTIKDGIGGKETFAQLLKYDPGIKGIIASGYTDNHVIANFQEYGFKAAICKPYSLKEFDTALKKVLSVEANSS